MLKTVKVGSKVSLAFNDSHELTINVTVEGSDAVRSMHFNARDTSDLINLIIWHTNRDEE